ncbi:MAG: hypothetical protein FWC64_03460 [Treponema sp.]|nr:hypothetical protein [Treponema sp.]
MKPRSSSFRSVEDWKSALMTLPDNGFFELLRSVFGNIKTPFSKQRLMDDLFKLLSRDDIRKTVAAYIDGQDHKVIAAIAFLGEPVPEELERFFTGELAPSEIHALLLNLEERLILYRFRHEGALRLALNPVLESVLSPFAANTGPLFPSFPVEGGDPPSPSASCAAGFAGSGLQAAVFAFLYGYSEGELLRAEPELQSAGAAFHGLRKRFLDDGKKIFPALDMELVVRALIHLELFRGEGSSLVPCGERIASYSHLSAAERQDYWAAGVYAYCNGAAGSEAAFALPRHSLRKIASAVHRFMGLLDSEKKYPEITLRRFMEFLGKEDGGAGNVWGVRLFDDRIQIPFDPFLAAMEKAGLLEREEHYWKVASGAVSGSTPAPKEKDGEGAVIVMDTAFSFILYPEIAFVDAMTLAAFCSVKAAAAGTHPEGAAVCFELTCDSVVRGFDQGMAAAGMTELLNRLSLNRLDETLGWTLKDWESRYAGVSLHHGIVLTLAEDRRYLAETKQVASLVRRNLAPGVYLFSAADRAEVTRALRKAGVDIIAQPPVESLGPKPKASGGWFAAAGQFRNSFSRFGPLAAAEKMPEPASAAGEPPPQQEAAAIKQKFHRVLEKMRLTKAEQDELEARIERRLILNEAQLEEASLRYEKLEARGLDYAGKQAIAKQAADSGALLDVCWPGPGGETKQILGRASALEKKGGESILVIRIPPAGDAAAGGTELERTIRIPLGKISLLRRIKQSIFGE